SSLGDLHRLPRTKKSNSLYKYDDNDGKGRYRLDNVTIGNQKGYDNHRGGKLSKEPSTRARAFSEKTTYDLIKEGRTHLPEDEGTRPSLKSYLSEVPGLMSRTSVPYELVGHSDSSKKYLDH